MFLATLCNTRTIGNPNIIHYIISFLVVGMYWIAYHRIFEHIIHANIILVWLVILYWSSF
ncbi:MAG: DUF1211 domain-containing protein [Nitrososphaeraceae archaeon]|nr:DUF1211 domain-containing protein [Nitrososphaeraceae archaeon]MBV9669298.1 DUF1211 domain-containing protein [Nitrososphaeraceae archaeon]